MGGYAWVTLATNDAYSLGALVLAHSLRRVGTKYELACLVTPGVTATMREKLAAVFSLVQEVNVLDSKDEANLALLARPELGITFTKLHCWRLTQYEKCVFVDADTLVVRNCDELFEREELSAAPDVGWPDCFNSGVFVFRPSQQTFASITAFAAAKGSFDGGDQGLLNMYFSDWATKDISKHLPFIYNMCSTATYSYLPAFKQFGEDVRIIHFIGITKPWLQYFDTLTGIVQPPSGSAHLQPLLQLWWNIFCERVHSQLSPSMAAGTLAPIWHAFAPPSYVPFIPEISVYFDARNNDVYSRTPDFSEFKDPWENYSPHNDSFPIDNSTFNDKSKNCYYEAGYEKMVDHRNNHDTLQHGHNQQFHYEQQHSSYAPAQTYDQQQYPANNEHRECAISHSEEDHSQRHSEHHWQQYSEQRYHAEQHRHNEQHHNEPRQHSEHAQHSGQSHDWCRNKADDHHSQHQLAHEQPHFTEVRHENRIQRHTNDSNQISHQNADYQNHAHNNSHAQHITPSNQHPQDNLSHCRYNEKNSKQSLEAANELTITRRIDFLPPPPAPCIDLHNVATRSDSNVTEHLDNANAGIAGALAQLTLGEARSAEQVALEEHMRKQSWEQGQIDYMGRDSFDNIWKKICETLSLVSQRQATPPKEDTVKSTESTATAEFTAPANIEADKPAVEAGKDPTQSLVCKVSEEKLSAAQTTCKIGDESVIVARSPEQKAPALPLQDITVETATKISSEPVATGDAKPTTETKDIKSCETNIETPSPKPPVESLPAKTIVEQCKLVSPQTTQETMASQGESLPLETKKPQQPDSQVSICLLADVICKPLVHEAITPVTQIDSTLAPIEAKPEIPAPATQEVTQLAATPISVDSPQNVAVSSVTSEPPVGDSAKRVIESAPDVMQPLTIDPSERHAEMLLAASEISTVSPVPIQVAESVLQAEPKESVSGAAAAVSDQAIATTVTAVHESTNLASAATMGEPAQLNGSTCEVEKCGDVTTVAAIALGLPEKMDIPAEAAKELASDSVIMKDAPLEASPAIEEKIKSSSSVVPSEPSPAKVEKLTETAEQIAKIEVEMKPSEQTTKTGTAEAKPAEQTAKTEAAETKPIEQIAKTETAEIKSAELIAKAKSTEQTEITEATTKLPSEIPESPIAEQSPPAEEPIETKAPNIPLTPTVIEATPPTSPSVESTQEAEEKAAKKSLKKSDSADGADGEGADKKGAKKTVKKVTKKPKAKPEEATPSAAAESAAADNSQSKAKKTVKVAKKIGTKTGQSLETDTSVPETPPPPSPSGIAAAPETPVPPKRKTKSTTVSAKGTTGKKPETEE